MHCSTQPLTSFLREFPLPWEILLSLFLILSTNFFFLFLYIYIYIFFFYALTCVLTLNGNLQICLQIVPLERARWLGLVKGTACALTRGGQSTMAPMGGPRTPTISRYIFFFFFYVFFFFFWERLYFQENFIWKTSILKTRTIKSLKEEEKQVHCPDNRCVATPGGERDCVCVCENFLPGEYFFLLGTGVLLSGAGPKMIWKSFCELLYIF